MDFYCVFVGTEINLIAFSGPRNCVNTQYAALSGAMPSTCPNTGLDAWPLKCNWSLQQSIYF